MKRGQVLETLKISTEISHVKREYYEVVIFF